MCMCMCICMHMLSAMYLVGDAHMHAHVHAHAHVQGHAHVHAQVRMVCVGRLRLHHVTLPATQGGGPGPRVLQGCSRGARGSTGGLRHVTWRFQSGVRATLCVLSFLPDPSISIYLDLSRSISIDLTCST